jgi:hypothetical protein
LKHPNQSYWVEVESTRCISLIFATVPESAPRYGTSD